MARHFRGLYGIALQCVSVHPCASEGSSTAGRGASGPSRSQSCTPNFEAVDDRSVVSLGCPFEQSPTSPDLQSANPLLVLRSGRERP